MKLKLIPTLVLATLICACATQKEEKNRYRQDNSDRPLVDDKYSLQADRKALEDLRADVPPEKKRENDEAALILQMTTEVKKSPSEIRNEFNSMVRKKRQLFDRDIKKEREEFTKAERKKREEFLKSQAEQKDNFKAEKRTRDESNRFYKDMDSKRRDYFSDEREKRSDYESDVRERRKSFEDYVRSKTNEFNQEHRAYQKKYDARKKEEREKKQDAYNRGETLQDPNAPVMPRNLLEDLMELDKYKDQPGTNLESGQ